MLTFILRRLLLMIPTTLGVAGVVFLIFQLAPGDPATAMLGAGAGGEMGGKADFEAKKLEFEIKHGLDRAWLVQYLDYIGPINLGRDGHSWFSSPYPERKHAEKVLEDGRTVVEGEPQKIDYPPDVPLEEKPRIEVLVTTLRSADASDEDRDAAERALVETGQSAWAGVMTGFFRQLARLEERDAFVRLDRVASELARVKTGREVSFAAEFERGTLAVARTWFGWYYTEGGGDRVQNSGADPWGGLILLDLGSEMQNNRIIADELWKRLRITVPLSLISVLLSYLIALPLGIYSSRRQGTFSDASITVVLFVLYSIPTFWFGLMMVIAFGVTGPDWWWWPQLPVLGIEGADAKSMGRFDKFIDYVLHAILPVATLTYGSFAYISRLMRAGMLDVIRQDYIRTARAKGLSERVVIYKHALRNSVIPVITLFASILPILIGGSVIVEKVFNIPGMGMYAFDGLFRRDFYIIMATTIFVGVMTQIGILLSDIAYSLVDPRIRHD